MILKFLCNFIVDVFLVFVFVGLLEVFIFMVLFVDVLGFFNVNFIVNNVVCVWLFFIFFIKNLLVCIVILKCFFVEFIGFLNFFRIFVRIFKGVIISFVCIFSIFFVMFFDIMGFWMSF